MYTHICRVNGNVIVGAKGIVDVIGDIKLIKDSEMPVLRVLGNFTALEHSTLLLYATVLNTNALR